MSPEESSTSRNHADAAPAGEDDAACVAPGAAGDPLEAILETVPSLIVVTDPDGLIIFFNRACEELTGYGRGEVLGKNVIELFVPPAWAPAVRRRFADPDAPEVRDLHENPWLTKSGEERMIEWRCTALPTPGGGRPCVLGAGVDVTGRGLVERRLHESEERFRQLAENVKDVFWITDLPERRVSYVSPAFERLWGLSRERLYEDQRVWVEAIHPEDRERTEAAFAGIASLGSFDEEYRITTPDGAIRWIRDRAFPLREGGDEVRRVAGIAEDITARKLSEAALAESERLLRLFLDNSPQPMGVVELDEDDTDVLHVYDNRASCRFFGVPDGSTVGRLARAELGVSPETISLWAARYRESERAGVPVRFDYEYDLLGEPRWLEVVVWSMGRGPSGRARFCYVCQDVTERRRLSESERAARAEAEEANRLKDEFLATLSHELRTPLTAILGWASMLEDSRLDPATAARAVEVIRRNAEAQHQLIGDLLDLSRIISGKLHLEVGAVDLASLIEAAADTVRPAAQAKGVGLRTILEPGAGPVSGDVGRLQQVVWNLLSNAVKFTPEGGEVEARLRGADGHVEIEVRDTGQGISPDFLPHVFDRFRQAEGTSARAQGGLGLGLSIVRQLVELHGGTVRAESRGPGQGASFTVSLPLMIGAATASPGSPAFSEAETPGRALPVECPQQLDGVRVLVVDDEADTAELVSRLLEGCGAEVFIAASAAEALEAMERLKPDVLVSDIGMPGEDGYDLIGRVREWEDGRGAGRVPAVALTAYARVEDRVRALRAGYQMHVPKPVEAAELIAAVASLAARGGKA